MLHKSPSFLFRSPNLPLEVFLCLSLSRIYTSFSKIQNAFDFKAHSMASGGIFYRKRYM